MSYLRPAPTKARKDGTRKTGEVGTLSDPCGMTDELTYVRNAKPVANPTTALRSLSVTAANSGTTKLVWIPPPQLDRNRIGIVPSAWWGLENSDLKTAVFTH